MSTQPHADPARVAAALLSSYWDGSLPVNPIAIARSAGIEVAALNPDNPDDTDLSGKYQRHGPRGRPVAYYCMDEAPVRIRFTVAHELGHHFLGHGDSQRDETFSALGIDPIEIAANQFAAALLMPETIVRHYVDRVGIVDIETLAKRFGVSQQAMGFRLRNLALA